MSRRRWDAETVQLVGGFWCWLTPEERNAWAEHVLGLPIYLAGRIAQAELDQVVRLGGDVEAAVTRMEGLQNELYAAAKAWHAEHIAPLEKETDNE